MEDNPFAAMVMAMREDSRKQIPAGFRLGTVISSSPLAVEVAGIAQDADSLLKNSLLTSFDTNDKLLLIPIEEEQRYIIVCKVVSA